MTVSEERGSDFGTNYRILGRVSDDQVEGGVICDFADEAFEEIAVEDVVDDRVEVAKEVVHLRRHRLLRWLA